MSTFPRLYLFIFTSSLIYGPSTLLRLVKIYLKITITVRVLELIMTLLYRKIYTIFEDFNLIIVIILLVKIVCLFLIFKQINLDILTNKWNLQVYVALLRNISILYLLQTMKLINYKTPAAPHNQLLITFYIEA